MSMLYVELYGTTIGTLKQKGKGYEFNTCSDVFTKYQVASTIMSLAVPLLFKYTGVQICSICQLIFQQLVNICSAFKIKPGFHFVDLIKQIGTVEKTHSFIQFNAFISYEKSDDILYYCLS